MGDQSEREAQMLAAMAELLSGHDNLYRAYFHYLPTCDPADDIAAKAARAILMSAKPDYRTITRG